MRSYLGLDLGTSSVKAVLVREDGTVGCTARATYPTIHPAADAAEQDADAWKKAIAQAVAEASAGVPVDAVGVAGHTPSLVVADEGRRAVHRALIWQDVRAGKEAAELEAVFGTDASLVGGTLPWNPAYLPAKLLWLSRHAPQALADGRWLMQPKDFIGFALTGSAATDIWSSKGLCRIDDGVPVTELFDLAAVSTDMLPPRRQPWEALGVVDQWGADWSGLAEGTLVATGWSDALAGMLAVGAFGEPTAFVLTGTSDIAGVSGRSFPGSDDVLYVPASCAPLPVNYGPTQTSGAAVVWLSEVLGRSVTDLLADSVQAVDSATPSFLPFLAGERAPLWRPDLRGTFSRIGQGSRAPELARAVLRGVSLSNRHVLDVAGDDGGPVHVGGRTGQDPAWLRARLETFGRPLIVHDQPEVAATGAAILAATADGLADIAATARLLSGQTRIVHPTSQDVLSSKRFFDEYREEVAALMARVGGAPLTGKAG